ncbi:MAG TPA: XrtB/PEP-CTERM-associated transcriptional regulator EpsA [Burkholderiales bacterium]|nr:XrtB/PEP-CTERM-associated transcriptional regulator EpsA [Burkholderiales bacterium]
MNTDHITNHSAATPRNFSLNDKESARFLRIVSDAQLINRHYQLFLWLNGELQTFLPHQIMISAWGDLAKWDLELDIVSALPGARTAELAHNCINSFLRNAHTQWLAGRGVPLMTKATESVAALGTRTGPLHDALRQMRTMLVHCVPDERSRQDSLYIVLSSGPLAKGYGSEQFAHLVQSLFLQIDSAFRRVASLPLASGATSHGDWLDLSVREQEILDLICHGKTNLEIAGALEISPFTVKNHVQRIFRKIGVTNRTQAATKYSQALRDLTKFIEDSRTLR